MKKNVEFEIEVRDRKINGLMASIAHEMDIAADRLAKRSEYSSSSSKSYSSNESKTTSYNNKN